MECETSGAKKTSLPPPVRNPPLAFIQTEKRRRGPDSLPPTPQRRCGPLRGPRATSDWKKRTPRVFSVEAAGSEKGGVLPRRWRDTETATRPGLASAHPAKGLRPFAGIPDALGLEKTRSARFRWRYRVRRKAASSPGAGGTQNGRRGPDSLPPTPQRASGPLQGPQATSD